mgnify:CR=1 FL=1
MYYKIQTFTDKPVHIMDMKFHQVRSDQHKHINQTKLHLKVPCQKVHSFAKPKVKISGDKYRYTTLSMKKKNELAITYQ